MKTNAPTAIFWLLFLLSGIGLPVQLVAQQESWLEEEVRLKSGDQTLAQAIEQLSELGISISYRSKQLPKKELEIRGRKRSIRSWLNLILKDTELTFESVGNDRNLVIFPDPSITGTYFTLYGDVYDARSGERLILANLYVRNRNQGVSSNEFGRYALHLPGGELQLEVSYVGYQKENLSLVLRNDSLLNIRLKPAFELQEITVTANSDSMIGVNPDAGGIPIGMAESQQLSGPGGESDPIYVTTLLSGITTGADGIGGINIRGSDASQNLILLDGVPVYNLSHAGGLFSIFNDQAIRRLDLYKNGLPARFGGRLSGVVDVHTKDGNLYNPEWQFSQSLLATRFTTEGPLLEGESSYLFSGRYFWAGKLVPAISRRYKARRGRSGVADYDLYDLNFKVNHNLGKNDHIYFSFYNGLDALENSAEEREEITVLSSASTVFNYDILQANALNISWGNSVGALRWTHAFNERLFGNLSLTYSNLNLRAGFNRRDSLTEAGTGVNLGSYAAGIFSSDIRQVGLAFDGQWLPRVGREVRFGGQLNYHSFQPLIVTSRSIDLDNQHDDFELPVSLLHRPVEINGYLAYVIRRPDLQFRAGMRGQLWRTDDGGSHFNISPRLLYTRRLTSTVSWQTTLDATVQAVHLLGSATIGLPTDVWVPSTKKVAPSRGYQASTGFRWKMGKSWEIESAVYGKIMEGLVEYQNTENLTGEWEDRLNIGSGRAAGLEVTLRKTAGKLRGWLAYTLARTERNFGPNVNEGLDFPFRYDRLHTIATLVSWHPNNRSSLTMTWRYGSGAAYSFNLANYNLPVPTTAENPEVFTNIATSRNGFRLPDLHRLDINYRVELGSSKKRRYTHVIDLGIYNVYDRHNEIYYELRTNYERVQSELKASRSFFKVFIAPVLPIFSYQIHFRGD